MQEANQREGAFGNKPAGSGSVQQGAAGKGGGGERGSLSWREEEVEGLLAVVGWAGKVDGVLRRMGEEEGLWRSEWERVEVQRAEEGEGESPALAAAQRCLPCALLEAMDAAMKERQGAEQGRQEQARQQGGEEQQQHIGRRGEERQQQQEQRQQAAEASGWQALPAWRQPQQLLLLPAPAQPPPPPPPPHHARAGLQQKPVRGKAPHVDPALLQAQVGEGRGCLSAQTVENLRPLAARGGMVWVCKSARTVPLSCSGR